MTQTIRRVALFGLAIWTALLTASAKAPNATQLGIPPPGFTSANARVNGPTFTMFVEDVGRW
jgi:hypothetical protein